MTTETTTLKTGEKLTIKILEPPLNDYADKVAVLAPIRDELVGGDSSSSLNTLFYVAELNGEVVGSMFHCTPADVRDVGLVEAVQTAEEHRRKGIASALLARLIERFKADGGRALYLSTSNPIAGALYEKHGFWYLVGAEMRYLAPGAEDFEDTYLAFHGKARVRDATWGDFPRAAVLYNHSEPQWFLKEYLTRIFRDMHFEGRFLRLMRRVENQRGAYLVLESPKQRVVGAAVLERLDSFHEQHVAALSFRVCPSYFGQVPELLNAAAQRAEDLAISTLQIHIADCDDEQKELVKAAGFIEESRLRDRLRDGNTWLDLMVYALHLPGTVRRLRSQEEYPGNRSQWHSDRIASVQSQRL